MEKIRQEKIEIGVMRGVRRGKRWLMDSGLRKLTVKLRDKVNIEKKNEKKEARLLPKIKFANTIFYHH